MHTLRFADPAATDDSGAAAVFARFRWARRVCLKECVNISSITALTWINAAYLDPRPAKLTAVNLLSLNLSGTSVIDLSALSLCGRALRSLDLSRTPVRDVAPLRACTELRSLDLDDTQVGGGLHMCRCQCVGVSHTPA